VARDNRHGHRGEMKVFISSVRRDLEADCDSLPGLEPS
jgi:hypothetical protein